MGFEDYNQPNAAANGLKPDLNLISYGRFDLTV